MKKMFVVLAALLVAAPASAVNKYTEDELIAMELENGAKSKSVIKQKDRSFAMIPVFTYTEAFDMETKSVIATKQSTDLTKGVEVPLGIATSPLFMAGGMNSATGMIGNTATIIAAAGIGLNFLNALFSEDKEGTLRKNAILQMKQPSFYLTRITPEVSDDAKLRSIQLEASQVAAALPFACEPGANLLGKNNFGTGSSGIFYERFLFCGYDSESVNFEIKNKIGEMRSVASLRFNQAYGSDGAASAIFLSSINKLNYTRMLGIPSVDEDQEALLGKLAYEKAKASIPSDWTAIYTAPNAKGEWAVFVARNGVTIEFPMPKS